MRKQPEKKPVPEVARTHADDLAAARKLLNEVFRAVFGQPPPILPKSGNGAKKP